MIRSIRLYILIVLPWLCFAVQGFSQTSWTGAVSTSWSTAGNWTAGVPTITQNAIIGDASFTGSFQPTISANAECANLTLGGAVNSTLTVSKLLTISGDLLINSGSTLSQGNVNIVIKGNWTNSGTYTPINSAPLPTVFFAGTNQIIGGSTTSTFRNLTVNAGSTALLGANVNITSDLSVSGTIDPSESPTYQVSGGTITVTSEGVAKVKASTFLGNYSMVVVLNEGSIVEYAANATAQFISSSYTYSTLKISGSAVKSLGSGLPALNSSTASAGNIFVTEGSTLDLSSFTADRGTSVAGGILSVSNNATLKLGGVGGTSPFPANFATVSLSLGSTVEYKSGAGTQIISPQTYGNLILSATSGTATKNSASGFTVAGNFTTTIATGTAVNFTAGGDIVIDGNVTLGSSTTFSGGSFTHTIKGNWANSGTFTGSTSTVNLAGSGTAISGSGTNNFNNLTISGAGITATNNAISISGDFGTSGPGTFVHASGGTVTMTGASKTITGSGITLNNLTISSGSRTSTATFTLTGNLSATGSLTCSSGTISMSGSSNTISGAGTKSFSTLYIMGNATITTAVSFTITSSLIVQGTFSASAGTGTFSGTTSLHGTANLFAVTISSGATLQLYANALLGIASTFTKTGTLNVTSTVPNTVEYNGSGSQSVITGTYHHLTLSNGGTKTASNALTVNGDCTINTSVTFAASTFTHNILGNFSNLGSFTASTGNMTFSGSLNTTISGTLTFSTLTINKSSSVNVVTLGSNISVGTLAMTTGNINTGSSTLTITTTRSGNGLIWGTITRTHTFVGSTNYFFEGPVTSLTFLSPSVTSVTMTVTKGAISDFPNGSSVNRTYDISISGTYSGATVQLHYEDDELNGNTEASMQLWRYNGSAWAVSGKNSNDASTNYVTKALVSDATNRWAIGDQTPNVVRWNGGTSAWTTAANWTTVQGTPSTPPGASDIVLIGTAAFTNQPSITTARSVRSIQFGSTQAATLSLSGSGTLTTSGNIAGVWSANRTHTLSVGSRTVTVGGDLVLSNGVSSRIINLTASTGTINVSGNLTESGSAAITFSGAGALNIGKNFNYVNGTFTPSTSTVTYNGTDAQTVGVVPYNNLVINKASGIAAGDVSSISNNLTVTSGRFEFGSSYVTIQGNVSIAASGTLAGSSNVTEVRGNWSNSGTFVPGIATVYLSGSTGCTISTSDFYNLTTDKSSGTATLTGNVNINNLIAVYSGTLDLSTFTANSTSAGGSFSVGSGATLKVGGGSNFPSSYINYSFDNTSNVEYNASIAQTVAGATYGNLTFTNGGINDKVLRNDKATVLGDLTINSGATFTSNTSIINLSGNWLNNGTFTPSTSGDEGTIVLSGTSKTITGTTSFNKAYIHGSYAVSGGNMTFIDELRVISGGSYDASTGTTTLSGNFTNKGTFTSNGTVTFSGNAAQVISLTNAMSLGGSSAVNFGGTVSPTLRSANAYSFTNVSIDNTISSPDPWTLSGDLYIGTGGVLIQGAFTTHTFQGRITNDGSINSNGTIIIAPTSGPQSIQLAGVEFTSTGTVIFDATSAMNVDGTSSFKNVIIRNTNAVTANDNWTILGNFIIESGSVFNADNNTYSISKDFNNSGTFNAGTSVVSMSSTAGGIYGSSGLTLYDAVVASSANITAGTNFNVEHNFTNNGGTINAAVGKIIFTGSNAGAINGSSGTYDLAQFDVNKSASIAVTLASNLTNITSVNVISGILDMADKTISQNGGSTGTNQLSVSANALLKIGSTNSLPTIGNYTLDSLSTVEYYGGNQTISVGATYGNLTLSSGGTKLAPSAITMKNNFTLSAATFDAAGFIHTVGGNWSMGSGTFSNQGTIIFNGTAVQNISSTGAFNSLTVNKTSSYINLTTDVTVNGTLTFTLGKIYTNANKLIKPSGTVTGAGPGTGWVNGNFQKNVSAGSNISRNFEIGDASNYTPVNVTFANVTGAGNLLAKTTATEHPQIATSDIIPDYSVNRYWTLTNVDGITFSTADATFNWVAGDIDASVVTSNFGAANYNGSTWSSPSIASPTSTSIQATGLTAFNDFAVGERTITPRWTGAIGTNWYTTGNWTTNSVPISTTNVLIPSSLSNYPIIASGTAVSNDLTIQAGASVTVAGAILQIGGIVSNSGTFTATAGTIAFNGSSAQNIPASTFASNTIKDLTINNTAGVTLGGTLNLTGALTISGGSLATGGYLTLKSSATAVAYVAQITSASPTPITGNVTVERYIPARRKYRLITSSVTTSTNPTLSVGQEALSIWGNWQNQGNNGTANNGTFITGGTAGDGYDQQTQNASFFTYDDVNRKYIGFTSANGKNTKYTPLKAGIAYYMFVYGDRTNAYNTSTPNNTVLNSTGTILTGDQTYTTASSIPLSNVTGRYTLLGNPFAAPIDWTTISRTNLANTYWGWDPNLSSTGGYITVTSTGTVTLISPFSGTTGLNQYIQPGQGFFVQTTAASPVLTIEEQDKVSNFNGNAFKVDGENGSSEANTIPLMAVNLQYSNGISTILADGVLTAFDPAFSNGIGKEDASKIPNTGEGIAILNNGQPLSIDARKMPQSDDTLFLNVTKLTKPQYTLQIFAQQISDSVEAYLQDAYLGTSRLLSLSDTNRIIFNVNADAASADINRFKIVFKIVRAVPGTFTDIKAVQVANDVSVEWKVAEEASIKKYEIEHSIDNITFTKVSEINAKGSNGIESYQWLDANAVSGNNYYRVRGIYNDGKTFLSNVALVNIVKQVEIKVYPNPVRGQQVNIRIKELQQGRYTFVLYNAQGQKAANYIIDHPGGASSQTINFSSRLPAGIYSIQIMGNNFKYVVPIIIQ